jgi:hypothetical protein
MEGHEPSKPTQEQSTHEPAPGVRQPERRIEETRLDKSTTPEVQKAALAAERGYSILGLVAGVLLAIIGAVLIVLGFTGAVDITFQSGKNSGHIVTGSLGVVFLIVGGIVIYVTRFRFTVGGSTTQKRSS